PPPGLAARRSRQHPVGVRRADVDRNERVDGPEVSGEPCVEAGAHAMAFVSVRGHVETELDELVAVADGAVAYAHGPWRQLELGRPDRTRTADEHLTALRVDDGRGAGGAGGECIQRRDAGRTETEREGEAARDREPDPRAGEAPGADAHRE